jgi:hypothetical protein
MSFWARPPMLGQRSATLRWHTRRLRCSFFARQFPALPDLRQRLRKGQALTLFFFLPFALLVMAAAAGAVSGEESLVC